MHRTFISAVKEMESEKTDSIAMVAQAAAKRLSFRSRAEIQV
jgi:hypothetical protein